MKLGHQRTDDSLQESTRQPHSVENLEIEQQSAYLLLPFKTQVTGWQRFSTLSQCHGVVDAHCVRVQIAIPSMASCPPVVGNGGLAGCCANQRGTTGAAV